MWFVQLNRADVVSEALKTRQESLNLKAADVAAAVTEFKGQFPTRNRNYSLVNRAMTIPLTVTVETLRDVVKALGGELHIVFPDE